MPMTSVTEPEDSNSSLIYQDCKTSEMEQKSSFEIRSFECKNQFHKLNFKLKFPRRIQGLKKPHTLEERLPDS